MKKVFIRLFLMLYVMTLMTGGIALTAIILLEKYSIPLVDWRQQVLLWSGVTLTGWVVFIVIPKQTK